MTRNEWKLLLGVTALGAVVLGVAALATGALLAANTSWSGLDRIAGREVAVRAVTSMQASPPVEQQAAEPAAAAADTASLLDRLMDLQPSPAEELPLPAPRVDIGADLSALYEQVNPGVVSVVVEESSGMVIQGQRFRQRGSGSGFVYDESHVVTNYHVVGRADSIEIVFFDGQRRAGTRVGADVYSDLAVIRVDDMPSEARVLPVASDLSDLKVGQPVVAIGNPFEKANSMTYGIVSALGRTIPDGQTSFSIPEAIQTDAAINPGNSGGPLLDLRGRVIGVNAQINTTNVSPGSPPGNSGVGFSIPASVVNRVVPELIANGSVAWSYMGVSGNTVTLAQAAAAGATDGRGAYIQCVPTDGPSNGRLRGSSNVDCSTGRLISGDAPLGGDVVVAVDGRRVTSFDDLLSYIGLRTVPGQEVTLTVLRDGQEVDVSVVLARRPERLD